MIDSCFCKSMWPIISFIKFTIFIGQVGCLLKKHHFQETGQQQHKAHCLCNELQEALLLRKDYFSIFIFFFHIKSVSIKLFYFTTFLAFFVKIGGKKSFTKSFMACFELNFLICLSTSSPFLALKSVVWSSKPELISCTGRPFV